MEFLVTIFFQGLIAHGWAVATETGCDPRGKVSGVDFVAGNLFAYKVIVRFVAIETVDDIVTVVPCMGANKIKFKSV